LSIVIRTAVITKDKFSVAVGGAIIALSDPIEEYEEILLKSSSLMKALSCYFQIETSNKHIDLEPSIMEAIA
jgi:para-aminobenzoate synthetase